MATQDISSLFGGAVLPQDMQQELINQRAKEFATLTPVQQLGMMGYKTGAALGGGLAQAMGVDITDPRIKRQAMLQQLAQGVQNTSEGLQAFAQKLSAAGFTAEAAQAMDKAREIAATEAGTKLKGAQAMKAENFEAARTDSEKKRTLLSDVEQALSSGEQVDPTKLNQARLAWAQETKPKTFQQPDGNIVTVPGVDINLFPNIAKALGSSAAGGVSKAGVIVTPAGQEAATTQAETAKEAVATVQNAINKVDEAANLYKNSKFAGGSAQVLAGLPMSTDARSLANLTSTIKSAFSVEEIAKLKAQSKTGATGFGSLAVKELETIQNAVSALDPVDAKFPEQLKTIRDSFDRWKKLMEQRSVRAEAKAAGQSPMSGKNPQIQPTDEAWVEKAMAKNPSYSRAQVITEGIKAGKLPADYK